MESRAARGGKNNRPQVATIPLEFRLPEGMKEVFLRRVRQDLVLSLPSTDWSSFLTSSARVSDDFEVERSRTSGSGATSEPSAAPSTPSSRTSSSTSSRISTTFPSTTRTW